MFIHAPQMFLDLVQRFFGDVLESSSLLAELFNNHLASLIASIQAEVPVSFTFSLAGPTIRLLIGASPDDSNAETAALDSVLELYRKVFGLMARPIVDFLGTNNTIAYYLSPLLPYINEASFRDIAVVVLGTCLLDRIFKLACSPFPDANQDIETTIVISGITGTEGCSILDYATSTAYQTITPLVMSEDDPVAVEPLSLHTPLSNETSIQPPERPADNQRNVEESKQAEKPPPNFIQKAFPGMQVAFHMSADCPHASNVIGLSTVYGRTCLSRSHSNSTSRATTSDEMPAISFDSDATPSVVSGDETDDESTYSMARYVEGGTDGGYTSGSYEEYTASESGEDSSPVKISSKRDETRGSTAANSFRKPLAEEALGSDRAGQNITRK